jgi:hypothetical protein
MTGWVGQVGRVGQVAIQPLAAARRPILSPALL